MNRRRFLALLGSTAVAPALPAIGLPEAEPLFGMSVIQQAAAHQTVLNRWVAQEMLRLAQPSLVLEKLGNVSVYSGSIYAKGDTIKFRRPRMFTGEAA